MGQVPVPFLPPSRISAGIALAIPTLARIESNPLAPVTAVAERTTTGELFIGYERDMNERFAITLSGHFMSVPMAIGFDEYELTDTIDGISGPLGRGSMRLGDWSKFGLQCNLRYRLRKGRCADLDLLVGARSVRSTRARLSYIARADALYTTGLTALQIVGQFDQQVSFGAVAGMRLTTRSRNSNGIQVTLLGAWFPGNGFTGTLYTLRGTSQERSARYTQGQSFISLSFAIYKSWGPPKVPMRLRQDREP